MLKTTKSDAIHRISVKFFFLKKKNFNRNPMHCIEFFWKQQNSMHCIEFWLKVYFFKIFFFSKKKNQPKKKDLSTKIRCTASNFGWKVVEFRTHSTKIRLHLSTKIQCSASYFGWKGSSFNHNPMHCIEFWLKGFFFQPPFNQNSMHCIGFWLKGPCFLLSLFN